MTDPTAKPTPSKTLKPKLNPSPGKLGAEKLTPEEQKRRFDELATELGCDQSEEAFNAALRTIARQKPKTH